MLIKKAKNNKNEFELAFQELAKIMDYEVSDDNIELLWNTITNEENSLAFLNNEKNNQVLTIHASKGKEFDLVFIFEKDYDLTKKDSEDLNNLYVAATRAKKQLVIFTSDIKNSNMFSVISQKLKLLSLKGNQMFDFINLLKETPSITSQT